MNRFNKADNLKKRILVSLMATTFPCFFVLPQVEASIIPPGQETTIHGSYDIGTEGTFALFNGPTESDKTIFAKASSDVTITGGPTNNYTIGMANGASNNSIRLDMQGHNLSIDGNQVIIGISNSENSYTQNNAVQILYAGDIALHTNYVGGGRINF